MKNSVNDSADAIVVCKAPHRSGTASDFTECTFDDVGGANLTTDKFPELFFDWNF